MKAAIGAIEYHLPESVLSTEQLAREFPDWSVEKIADKTGIQERHIAGPEECASDLAQAAAEKLFAAGDLNPGDIDYLLLCTQSPDYFLPTTACLLQHRLGIPTDAGALDFNLGCSGFVYGLGLAQGLIESGQARNLLLMTAETYSKYIHPTDRSVRTIFGDAAAAVHVKAVEGDSPLVGPFVFGTDGSGGKNLIVPAGGLRQRSQPATGDEDVRGDGNLFMDGPEIFNFTVRIIPKAVSELLDRAGIAREDVDLFVLHQANRHMLNHLRRRMKIPEERFCITLSHCANTVSSTIPIALKHAALEGRLKPGQTVMLVGFGVGYSWAACMVRWTGTA